MRTTHDEEARAIYVHLDEELDFGRTITMHGENEIVKAMVNVDVDATGKVIGVEILY